MFEREEERKRKEGVVYPNGLAKNRDGKDRGCKVRVVT
jgi:hypothetical protein